MPKLANIEGKFIDDGAVILNNLVVKNEAEDLGIQILRDAANRTNQRGGDGTTTTTILAQKLAETAFNRLGILGVSSQLAKELEEKINEEKDFVLAELDKMKKEVKDQKELAKVASVSIGNKDYGEKVAEIIWKTGVDNAVLVENNLSGYEVETQLVEGVEFIRGYITPFMATEKDGRAILENPSILVYGGKIKTIHGLLKLADQLATQGKRELLVLTNHINYDLLPTLIKSKRLGSFNVCVVKLHQLEAQEMEEIAIIVGGTCVNEDKGMNLEQQTIDILGTCEKAVIAHTNTILMKPKKQIKEAEARIKYLKQQIEAEKKSTNDPFHLKQYKRRLAQLQGGVGLIRVGAPTESEQSNLIGKFEDCVNATTKALEEGIIKGGGMAFKEIAKKLPKDSLLKQALEAPYEQLKENAGGKFEVSKDIYDPVKVMKLAVENACSVVKQLINTETVIADKKWDLKEEFLRDSVDNAHIMAENKRDREKGYTPEQERQYLG